MSAVITGVRYLWQHRFGRLAVLMIVVGVVGLTLHFWTTAPLLLTLPRPRDIA